MSPLAQLRNQLNLAAAKVAGKKLEIDPTLERPPRPEFGDYSTNAALLLSPVVGSPPREVAAKLAEILEESYDEQIDKVEVAGPGFVNLFLSDRWYVDALTAIGHAGEGFVQPEEPVKSERVLVEFVSANPTGPLTAAGGRHAAYGDALARLLSFVGHTVEREFYVNDSGGQIERLGESIKAVASGDPIPEDGYKGDYVVGLAKKIENATTAPVDEIAAEAVRLMLADIKATLASYNVEFDRWFSERSLYSGAPNEIEHALAELAENKRTYRSEGALWLNSTQFGDDKDRVLQRGNGEYTYFAKDIAYHLDKSERGNERLIDVLGADHHGYIGRMKAAFHALGRDPQCLEIVIMQLVHIVERGERSAMSKRRGDFVTLRDLIDDIGVDATRFFMLQRSNDTTVDLDLDLARSQSNENPVYYVQYAHARIASILRKHEQEGSTSPSATGPPSGFHQSERELVKMLLSFPQEAIHAAERRAPHRIAAFALELAQTFTAFYRDCRVVGAQPVELEKFRIDLCARTKTVLARCLGLLGVSAPTEM